MPENASMVYHNLGETLVICQFRNWLECAGVKIHGIPDFTICNVLAHVTSCVLPWEEEPQTAYPKSLTWASHIAASVLMGK